MQPSMCCSLDLVPFDLGFRQLKGDAAMTLTQLGVRRTADIIPTEILPNDKEHVYSS